MNGVRELSRADTLQLVVSQPFSFRYTFWKPSHFATGLEAHTARESWRTFRIDSLTCGVHAQMADDTTIQAGIYGDKEWTPAYRDRLRRRLQWSYGLDEDLSAFTGQCERVPAMREPLSLLGGMRQSCPENLFEIAIISLLLQNATIARTTQMLRNLLTHYGQVVRFADMDLHAFFTPGEIANVPEERFRLEDRLGYRAKYIGRFAEFFAGRDSELEGAGGEELPTQFQQVKGVGPYTASVIASHASRDPSALGLDVWNRKLLARYLMGADDAGPGEVMAAVTRLFPGNQGLAALYLIEYEYSRQPVVPLLEQAPTA